MNISTIQDRFNSTFKIILKFWKKYLLFNLLTLIFWLVLFFVIPIPIYILLWLSNLSLKSSSVIFFNLILLILVFVLVYRFFKSAIFLWNFYITKNIVEEKNIPTIKQLFSIIFSKLFSKMKVDFWYFLVFLPVILITVLLAFLLVVWQEDYIKISLFFTCLLFIFIFCIYIIISFYLSYYYSFDKEKFTFKEFLSSKNITNWKKMSLLGNVLLISILSGIVYWIFLILLSNIVNINHNSWWISIVIFIIFRYVLATFVWLFTFVYFYLYYLYLTWYNLENFEKNKKTDMWEKKESIEK